MVAARVRKLASIPLRNKALEIKLRKVVNILEYLKLQSSKFLSIKCLLFANVKAL
jgi:hypothetical protein